jgi:hypothetical protein
MNACGTRSASDRFLPDRAAVRPRARPFEWTTFTMPVAEWAADDNVHPAGSDNRKG